MTKLLVDGKNAFPEIIACMRNAQKSIHINMFIWRDDAIGNRLAEEVLAAAERGVKVTLVISARANFQDDSNKRAVYRIMKNVNARLSEKAGGSVTLWFSPKMLHTKLVATESVQTTIAGSTQITSAREITYNPFVAFLESFLV